MSLPAIRTYGLGKRYRIGSGVQKHDTFRDMLLSMAYAPIERLKRLSGREGHESEMIWALKDIDLEVRHGEVIGIIGSNGAGKSTLLKILTRITQPTVGHAEIFGRCGSLLEVGTGFHPELSGRENVYLNGAILGMTRKEIDNKFDEIVAFAEVEKFIDTPSKRYSSGMQVRLAFAVAAHLEPEILIVDEVLAVGDASFQRKCIGKMSNAAEQCRTVLFVSHNMSAIRNLCSRCVWLKDGQIYQDGPTAEIVDQYIASTFGKDQSGSRDLSDDSVRTKNALNKIHKKVFYTYLELTNDAGKVSSIFTERETIHFTLRLKSTIQTQNIVILIQFLTLDDIVLTSISPNVVEQDIATGEYEIKASIPDNNFVEGTYRLRLWLQDEKSIGQQDLITEAMLVRIETPMRATDNTPVENQPMKLGVMRTSSEWGALTSV